MNLRQIRTKFREISGRYDLVNEDLSDNGSDFYINEAIKWLDRTVETTKSWGSRMQIVPVDTWYIKFPQARAVKEVWVATTEGKWQLEKKRLQDILSEFYTQPINEWESGTPLYYSPTITRTIPTTIAPADLATFMTYVGVISLQNPEYNAIVLSVPTSLEMLVDIVGLFYSDPLVNDEDENYWSVTYPLMLINAAVRQIYIASGNRPFLDILERGIGADLKELGFDLVEQMIAEIDEMEG